MHSGCKFFYPKPLTFDEQEQQREASVERLVLSDQVHIWASEVDHQGNKVSREQIDVPSLTYHVADNQIVSTGPGWITANYQSDGRLGLSGRTDETNTNGENKLTGNHLRFRDSMVGFLDRREVIFEGQIELAGGPLSSWDAQIDLDQMRRLTMDQMLLNCDQLKVYDTSSLSSVGRLASAGDTESVWEMQATGNVAFNGKAESGEYRGAGYQITYTQAKDLLLLRSDGRGQAWLQRSPSVGSTNPRSSVVQNAKLYVKSAAINVKTLAVDDLQISQGGFQLEMDPSVANRGANPQNQGLPSTPIDGLRPGLGQPPTQSSPSIPQCSSRLLQS